MANAFLRKDAVLGTSDTLVYTCPGATVALIFDATVTNIDSVNKASRLASIWIKKVDLSLAHVFMDLEIPYGRATPVPFITLAAGEKLYVKGSAAGVLGSNFQIVERT